jgi:hypothetical protein
MDCKDYELVVDEEDCKGLFYDSDAPECLCCLERRSCRELMYSRDNTTVEKLNEPKEDIVSPEERLDYQKVVLKAAEDNISLGEIVGVIKNIEDQLSWLKSALLGKAPVLTPEPFEVPQKLIVTGFGEINSRTHALLVYLKDTYADLTFQQLNAYYSVKLGKKSFLQIKYYNNVNSKKYCIVFSTRNFDIPYLHRYANSFAYTDDNLSELLVAIEAWYNLLKGENNG